MDFVYSPKNKKLVREGNKLINKGKFGDGQFTLSSPVAANSRVEFSAKIPLNGEVVITTGRGSEKLYLKRRGNVISWYHSSTNGAMSFSRQYPGAIEKRAQRYWWENTDYSPNGRFSQNFTLTPAALAWNAFLQNKYYKDVNNYFFPIAIEVENGRIRFYLDNVLLQEQAVSEDIHDVRFKIQVSGGTELTTPVESKIAATDRFFTPINITSKYNAKGDCKVARSGRITVDGIPFEVRAGNQFGDCVDLSQIWFREGGMRDNSEPHRGSFGGRWAGALGGSRTRMQFRVANRDYNCIYVLASSSVGAGKGSELSAQFFRPGSGLPLSFTPSAPLITDGKLRVIRIPVTTGFMKHFADREVIELELTGKLHTYRAYPDPCYYSVHGAGLPPGVKVYAVTLGINPDQVSFEPEVKGNLWVEQTPAYTVSVTNHGDKVKDYTLKFTGYSYYGKKMAPRSFKVTVEPRATWSRRLEFPVPYGWSRVDLDVNGEKYYHTMVKIRKRNQKPKDFYQKGHSFGAWIGPGGLHYGIGRPDGLTFLGKLGISTSGINAHTLNDRSIAGAVKAYGLRNYQSSSINVRHVGKPDIKKILLDAMAKPSAINQPVFQYVFAEPGGIGTNLRTELFGEPKMVRTPAQEERFQSYKKDILHFAKVFRELCPGQKLLVPWGDSSFCAAYVEDPDTRPYVDGFGLDIGYFDRLPEQQFHQASIHRLYQFFQVWYKYKKEAPLIVCCEGPCIGGVKPGALTEAQHAAHLMRIPLILSAYGIRHQFSGIQAGPGGSSYWAEQHYSGGGMTTFTHNPRPAVASQATLIRHLLDAEFVKWIPTGSLATYCLQYRDVKTKKKFLVMWVIKGKRTATVKGKVSAAFDAMDNPIRKLTVTPLPIFVHTESENISFSKYDHSDIKLAKANVKLAEAGELFTSQTGKADTEYLDAFPAAIRRFPGKMELKKVGKALDITLLKQDIDRTFMPYYTTLLPAKKVVIPGKAKYITMEVTAASDWGRLVYVLRDAKGEKWTSAGIAKSWNNDDTPNHSFFNFDGKRLVRIELPSHLEWDGFREMGTTWWGSSGGDGVVDLPLTLEKVYVERRHKAMYVNSLEPVSNPTVTLGSLYAEYENKAMISYKPGEKMPLPDSKVASFNPIEKLAKSATLPASEITKLTEPNHYYDGTRGVFFFKEMPKAARYAIYLSRHADGTNALCLHGNIKKSGTQVNGFLAETDFYAFVVYYDKAGNNSKPSKPFKLNMKDNFGNK